MNPEPIDIFKELQKLNFPKGEYVVVGSGIMAAKGIRPAYDLDIVVTQKLFDDCLKNGWELKPWTRVGKIGKEWLKKDGVELMLEMGFDETRVTAEDLIKDAEVINDIYFINFERLIQFKREYGRKKDFDDIKLIEDYLRNNMSI